jgi:hypothetical protein
VVARRRGSLDEEKEGVIRVAKALPQPPLLYDGVFAVTGDVFEEDEDGALRALSK